MNSEIPNDERVMTNSKVPNDEARMTNGWRRHSRVRLGPCEIRH